MPDFEIQEQEIEDTGRPSVRYLVIDKSQNKVVMIFDPKQYQRMDNTKGWLTVPHTNFIRIELSEKRDFILAHYSNRTSPVKFFLTQNLNDQHYKMDRNQMRRVLDQMKEKGLIFDDFWSEYYHGTNTTYSWDKERNRFICTEMDVIAASFITVQEFTPDQMIDRLLECVTPKALMEHGFILF